jgi:ADP-L-glycero-D-manno-heptose 6-epimerase
MIIVTGGAGFIGSNYIELLNKKGITDIRVVDIHLNNYQNLNDLQFKEYYNKDDFPINKGDVVVHLGANSDTTATSEQCYYQNYQYTVELYEKCKQLEVPFIYASSASVYGNKGTPLNYYAMSKFLIDKYINGNAVGLRFFNVYGEREQHKGKMKSFVSKIKDGELNLFKGTGKYKRDYVYVKDVCKVIDWFRLYYIKGIYDVGTGKGVSYYQLFRILNKKYKLVEMPSTLKDKLQVNTKANLKPLRKVGCNIKFKTIKEVK